MKTKLFNKALSGLLASAMALSVFAIGASAEGECSCTECCTNGNANAECPVCKDTDDSRRNYINCLHRPTSGTCGATANWNITKNGVNENGDDTYTVTISGTGAMEDYDKFSVWSDYYRDFITKIVIGYGITDIGDRSFKDCEKATEVVIERNASGESSVRIIGEGAFRNCGKWTEIEIPASVEEIKDYAFKGTYTEITFEEGIALTSIGVQCFYGNTSLVECIIPSKVTSIGNYAFRGNPEFKRFYYPADAQLGTGVFYSDGALEYFGRYTVNEANKTCSIEYLGVGVGQDNDDERFPDEDVEITAEIVVPEKIDGYKVTSVKIGETTVDVPQSLSVSHTTTKLSDIPKKDGWTYTAASETIPVGTMTVTASYAINETQTITREITISRPSCSYGSSWATNAESHWHECSCGNTSGFGSHTSSGEATPDSAEVCSVCGYEIAPATGYVATPVISPEGSEFKDEVKITISTETEGAEIFFTTDGSDPTTESEKYSGEITLSQSATIKAIAVKDGMGDSEIASAEFVKKGPQIKNGDGKTGWDAIADELLTALTANERAIVQMNGETEVPAEILALIKGIENDLAIELDNGFTWTINGASVTDDSKAVNLAVDKGSTIPIEVINAVAGVKESLTLTLAHEGKFGFDAALTLDLGAKYKGRFANLYWYTNGGTELISSAEISSDGKADLKFNHASEYVVVIDDENHSESSDSAQAPDSSKGDNAETGVALSLVGVIASAAVLTLSRKRK